LRREIEVEVSWHGECIVKEASSEVSGPNDGILCFSVVVEQDWVKLSAVLVCEVVDAEIEVTIGTGVDELVEALIYDMIVSIMYILVPIRTPPDCLPSPKVPLKSKASGSETFAVCVRPRSGSAAGESV